MANLTNNGDQLWTDPWRTTELAQLTFTAPTATTTGTVYSAALAGSGAVTVDGVILWGNNLTGIGTVTVWFNNTITGDITSRTINASDLPREEGEVFVSFPAGTVISTSAQWRIGISASVAGNAQFWRSTAGNWTKLVRSTTTAAIATTDHIYVVGELNGAGSLLNKTLTLNQNSASGTTDCGGVDFGLGAIIDMAAQHLGTTGTTQRFWPGCHVKAWTAASRSTGTQQAHFEARTGAATIFISSDAIIETGGRVFLSKTKLAADVAATGTSVTTAVDTNWDTDWGSAVAIVLASTSLTQTQSETKNVSTGSGGNNLAITAVTNAHAGTAGYEAEIALLRRRVLFSGVNAATACRISISDAAIVDFNSTDFAFLHGSGRGIEITASGLSGANEMKFNNCVIRDGGNSPADFFSIVGLGADKTLTVNDMVSWNCLGSHFVPGSPSTALGTININGWLAIYTSTAATPIFDFTLGTGANHTYDNMTAVSGDFGFAFGAGTANTTVKQNATLGTLVAHSCDNGFALSTAATPGANSSVTGINVASLSLWRNAKAVDHPGGLRVTNMHIGGGLIRANTAAGVVIAGSTHGWDLGALSFDGGTSPVQPYGINVSGMLDAKLAGCSFGSGSAHGTAAITGTAVAGGLGALYLDMRDTVIADAVEIQYNSNDQSQVIKELNKDGTLNSHKVWTVAGVVTSDTAIKRSGTRSERLTPDTTYNLSNRKVFSGRKQVAVLAGDTPTVGVYVRCSATGAGDAATYNGSRPKLYQIVPGGTDILLATATTAANGNWELLSASLTAVTYDGVVELEVRVDGSAGWVNVDDWQRAYGAPRDPGSGDIWGDGYPAQALLPVLPQASMSMG